MVSVLPLPMCEGSRLAHARFVTSNLSSTEKAFAFAQEAMEGGGPTAGPGDAPVFRADHVPGALSGCLQQHQIR